MTTMSQGQERRAVDDITHLTGDPVNGAGHSYAIAHDSSHIYLPASLLLTHFNVYTLDQLP